MPNSFLVGAGVAALFFFQSPAPIENVSPDIYVSDAGQVGHIVLSGPNVGKMRLCSSTPPQYVGGVFVKPPNPPTCFGESDPCAFPHICPADVLPAKVNSDKLRTILTPKLQNVMFAPHANLSEVKAQLQAAKQP